MAIDVSAWVAGLWFALLIRLDLTVAGTDVGDFVRAAVLASGFQVLFGVLFGLYIGRWRFGSFDEVAALARTAVLASAVLFVVVSYSRFVPLSVTLGGGVAALVGQCAVRYAWRLALEHARRPTGENAHRVLVFGAGEGGAQAVTAMLRDPDSPYVPVAFLDDDRSKRHLKVMGVPVVGTRLSMGDASKKFKADTLLVAIPSAGHELMTELADLANDARLKVSVLPPTRELLGARIGVQDIRPISEADLLGRHEIKTDLRAIAGYLKGKRVLVTGAGGSIGSELCRQIKEFEPSTLVMLDRDESGLHATQLSIDRAARLDSRELVVADIRDEPRIREVFEEHQPQVVFHAAALKHVPLLELHPREGVLTNVVGTKHVLLAAQRTGVEKFINISTDKAADPVNVLGRTKRAAEQLTAWFASESPGTYLSVRFGNVLGSRGSMLQTFREQIVRGGPITVTHPEVTRYFMTVEEAVQLVIQAGAIGGDGEALVLDMGQPVRIADVAKRLAAQADRPVEVVYTGLRPGEKLHEVLFGQDESAAPTSHELISRVTVPPAASLEVASLDGFANGHVTSLDVSLDPVGGGA